MSQSASDIPWPFAGRIMHALGDELLPRPWLCLRVPAGLRFTPVLHPGPVSLPPAARALLEEYRVPTPWHPLKEWPLLGAGGVPHRLSARAGTLLSDYLLAKMPTFARDLHDPQTQEIGIDVEHIIHLMRILYSELYRKEIELTGLRYPPEPWIVQQIAPERLPSAQLDLATDFARPIGTETFLCDLRVVVLVAASAEPDIAGLMIEAYLAAGSPAGWTARAAWNAARKMFPSAKVWPGRELSNTGCLVSVHLSC